MKGVGEEEQRGWGEAEVLESDTEIHILAPPLTKAKNLGQ